MNNLIKELKKIRKANKKRKKSLKKHHQTEEGKKAHKRMLNFVSNRPEGYTRGETKLRNMRLAIETSNKINELAEELQCTFSHVVDRLVLEYGDTLKKSKNYEINNQ